MTHRYRRALHVFRRDLRLEDNTALHAALEGAQEVLLLFVLDPRQVGTHPYRSTAALQFMRESLEELSRAVAQSGSNLQILPGDATDVIANVVEEERIEAVYFNRDYTPFARNRDKSIKVALEGRGVSVHQFGDALLHEPEEIQKKAGGPYTVYTPFMKGASQIPVRRPSPATPKGGALGRFATPVDTEEALQSLVPFQNPRIAARGGRSHALEVLTRIATFKNYLDQRDFPALNATTGLSAHHKFGTVSAREVFWAVADSLGPNHTLIRELYWRDFFSHIAFHFPHVFKGCFHKKYDTIEWENDQKLFAAWCEGRTGFPIVDAGMRELSATGFMHNRVRMIVASFLVKDLLIDWRWGERYFATTLVDYDPAVNNGNWQWAASTGCDAQPYFRIFNPWLQQERFDPDATYIKRWIPELKSLSPKEILKLRESPSPPTGYPAPIVEHAERKTKAVRLFEVDG